MSDVLPDDSLPNDSNRFKDGSLDGSGYCDCNINIELKPTYLIGTEAQLDYSINKNQSLIFGLVYEYSDVEKGYRGYESVPRFYNSYNSFYRTILKDKSLFSCLFNSCLSFYIV